MKIGKVPEEILVRSILDKIGHRRREVLLGPAVGQDCAALAIEEDEVLVMSSDPITGTDQGLGHLGIMITTNDIAAAGAEPIGVTMTLLLPDGFSEEELDHLMSDAEEACRRVGVEILGGHTEITDAVNRPVVSVTGVGKMLRKRLTSLRSVKSGDALIVTKSLALEAVSIIASVKKDQLLEVLPEDVIKEAISFGERLSVIPESRAVRECEISSMHDITEGGIYGALWEMGAGAGLGMEVLEASFPVEEASRLVCEAAGIDPFRAMSSGSMLITASEEEVVVAALEKAGIEAAVIGHMTDDHERRVILKDGGVMVLDRPMTDALYDVI